ncbi:MAG: T9SS type B sorting domain-containing protein, partial [Bacteroidetes bacterium]|nr:T9SS type B sorting domain-containing protein [Bacteroidota bacterium]
YTIAWTGTGTGHTSSGASPNDLITDTYDVSITDAMGCVEAFNGLVTITEPNDIMVTVDNVVDVECYGEATGAIDITPTGGNPVLIFSWSGPNGFNASTEDIANLEGGTYNLTITDPKGCTKDFTGLATIGTNTAIDANFALTDITCNGVADGAIVTTVSGGTPIYYYKWTGPFGFASADKDISGLIAGDYQLTITDDLGCMVMMPVQTLTQPDPVTAVTTQVDVDCFGANNGSVDLSSADGVAPHFFAWTGPNGFTASTEDISGLEPGAYSLTITDGSGCVFPFPDIVTITEPAELAVNSTGTDISCGGLTDGAIDITVTGGTPLYTYGWSGPGGFVSSDEDITGLAAGTYDLSVTDANGCSRNFPGVDTIIEPTPILAIVVSQVNLLCNGDTIGSIDIDVSGGIAPLVFDWTNGAGITVSGDEDPVGLVAGSYSLNISDLNGCSVSYPDMVTLTQPPPIVSSLTETPITCFEDDNGTISVITSGGNGSYEYSLDGTSYQAGAAFTPLAPGFYTIWTRDASLCIVTDTITLIEPAEVQVVDDSRVEQIKCHGDSSGSIAIDQVTGGIQPYTYSINNGADFFPTSEFPNLPPGSYQTVVMDASGCIANGSLNEITEPAELKIGGFIQDDISSCSDAAKGRILITGAGGTSPYSYVLNDTLTNTTGEFLDLPAGTHNLSIKDFNDCSVDTAVMILAPPDIVVDLLTLTDVSGCAGDTSGAVTISGLGGTGTISYSLDGSPFRADGIFSGLLAGNHTLTLLDDNGCTADTSIILNEPAPVFANVVKTNVTYEDLGSIEITGTTGGTPPFEYTINGPGGTFSTETLYSNLDAGSYHVIARDAIGCMYELIVNISDVLLLDVGVNVTNISCFGEVDGIIQMVPQNAEGAVEYSIDSGVTFLPADQFGGLAGDTTYNLVARDAAGKVFTGTATITEPAEINFSKSITPAECNAFSETGAINITVSGGTPDYNYLWSDGSTEEDRNGIMAGTYTLQTSDANGCMRSDTMLINSLIIVDAFAGSDTTICYGDSVQLDGQGGYTPSWSPLTFLSDPDIANPMAVGVTENISYVLTISDDLSGFGCFDTDTVTIAFYPMTGVDVTRDTFITKGNSVQLEALGGPFSAYRWEPPTGLDNTIIPNPVATPQQSTRYKVYALNEFECEESDSVYVEVIEDLIAYNVFSPNGDGINDFFDIKNAERFPDILVEVYSRWGDLFFSTRGYDDGSRWDGTTRGTDAPMGTYYYVIIPYSGAMPITGNVTIIR